jgi:hypothetical protein
VEALRASEMGHSSRLMELRTSEELLAIGFSRSRVVMMNEAHHLMKRCVRTREIGRRLLPAAHAAGVRHFAIEALHSHGFTLPDMQRLVDGAEELGWKVIPYEEGPSVLPPDPEPPSIGACIAGRRPS